MRILFDNKVLAATASALHADPAYPVTNIQHPFLKKIFKSTEATDTIAIDFGSAMNFDSCYIGLTNAQSININFYNASHTFIASRTIPATTLASVFSLVSGARYAELTMSSGTDDLYVGTIALGIDYAMPDPLSNWLRSAINASKENESDGGQLSIEKVAWRRRYSFGFVLFDEALYSTIYALLAGINSPIWVDPFEDNRSMALPVYAHVVPSFEEPREEGGIYRIAIEVREVC